MSTATVIGAHEAEVNSGAEIDTGNGGQANTCRWCSRWCRRTRYGTWRHVPASDRLNSPSGTWNATAVAAPGRGRKGK